MNKAVLEIRLPDIPPRVRKTLTLLLNELFVTAFPNAHQYVIALTEDAEGEFGDLLSGASFDHETTSIFIVEDSMIDLGLIVVVERYWQRFFEIITDYLAWNSSPPPVKKSQGSSPEAPTFPDRPEAARSRSWFGRLWSKIRRKRAKEPAAVTEAIDAPETSAPVEETPTIEVSEEEPREIEQGGIERGDVEPHEAEHVEVIEEEVGERRGAQ